MKRKNYCKLFMMFSLAIGITLFLQSCQKEEEADNLILDPSVLFEQNDFNTDMYQLTKAVGLSLRNSQDFRKLVKHEALLMIDGDYDVRINMIKDREIPAPPEMKKSLNGTCTVRDLIESYFPEEFKSSKKVSTVSLLDELAEQYPDLQIAVPVHAEDWDESSYIPTVTFIPAEFDDLTTESVAGIDSGGDLVVLDAVNEPDDPVIVLSISERTIIQLPTGTVTPPVPTTLKGTQTESGIRLDWTMPDTTSSLNTTGYYIYRKASDENVYSMVKSLAGYYNRSYNDYVVIANKTYSYYVVSYYQTEVSRPSNYISVTAPSYPKPVLSFDAIQNSKYEIECRWDNDYSQYISETRLYKHVVGVTTDYGLLSTFSADESNYMDHDIEPGRKIIYKINHVTDLGESNSKYDFVQVPYRDIQNESPVYINKIHFDDWSIESWLAGKPEFYVTVMNIDKLTGDPYTIQDQIKLNFDSRSSTSQEFDGVKVLGWRPDKWYDMLSFYAEEYDRDLGKFTIKVSVGYNQKNIDSTGLSVAGSVGYEITLENKGEQCGNAYLNYFDEPEQWMEFPNYGTKILISEND